MLVDMQKLVLIAHGAQRNKILRALHRSKLVMVSATSEIENTSNYSSDSAATITEKQSRVSFALDFLKGEKKKAQKLKKESEKESEKFEYTPIKVPIQSVRVSYEDFLEISNREEDLLSHIQELENIDKEYLRIANEIQKLSNFIEQLDDYKNLNIKFSNFTDTKTSVVALGTVPIQKSGELTALIEKYEDVVFEVYGGTKQNAFSFVCLKERADELLKELQALEYTRTQFNFDKTVAELTEGEQKKIEKFEERKKVLLANAIEKEQYMSEFKELYDYYLVELAKQSALELGRCTKTVFVLEGWFPKCQAERLEAIFASVSDEMIFEFREPEDDDEVPTLVKSKKLFDPFEDVTNLYSPPNYREDFDPNPIMSFFYFLFFGMMVADAGYGIVLAIGAFVFYKLKRPAPGKGRLLLIISLGGVSTVIWGALFGGWFGLAIGGSFLSKLVWFEPLGDPLLMLILCLALGVFQVVVGMGLNAYNLIRKGKVLDAVFEVFTWFAILIGLGLLVVNSMLVKADALKIVSIVLMLLGAVSLVLGNSRGKKGVGGKIKASLSGLGKLYDGVNILSDVLSYSRLFGLALSGGVVGMVINKICEVLMDLMPSIGGLPIIGLIISIPVFMVGHLFNIGISTLGAYVHNCRLQYIEFYGKFYTGAGVLFKPLGNETKYVYVESEKKTVA